MEDDVFDLDENLIESPLYNEAKQPPFWLNELNPEQKKAVEYTQGPLLVLSGAGTGKTKVLTTRLAYILINGLAQPWNCLVVTFTNRAAGEMKERVQNLIGDAANSVWLGTFHSICVKILRNYAELVGLKPNFTILGEDDQKRLIKQIIEDEGIDEKKYPPISLVEKISLLKDKGLTFEKAQSKFSANVLLNVYQKYQKRLLELNCVDFGDILLYTLILLQSNVDVLAKYQDKFKYIMVDEYQDTNVTQYLLLRLLSQKNHNLCCVGDDDQSIYSWRGAEIENIMRFQKDFPDAQIIRLERNYRSTANILNAASSLILHNKTRLGKMLRVAENSPANNYGNEKIAYVKFYNGEKEAQWITAEIKKLCYNGYNYSGIAILVRTAFQTREFEEKLISETIPYQVIGGPKFYERAEIKDILAYLRVLLQPDDDLAFERIVNKPTRGIGAKTIEKIRTISYERQISMFKAVDYMLNEDLLTGKAKNNLNELMQKFYNWQNNLKTNSPADVAEQIIEQSGYKDMLNNDTSAEAKGRIENLQELVNVMSKVDIYPTLADFLEHVSLVMDTDNNIDHNKVMLITLHSAKGLEFDVVFLPGWEEELFPHEKSLYEGDANSLEEERRLAYVAITRAKQKLYITNTEHRLIYGQIKDNRPSRFLSEIPQAYISEKSVYTEYNAYSYRQNRYNKTNKQSYYYNQTKSYNNAEHEYSYEPTDEYDYAAKINSLIGIRVYHENFGYGKIVSISGNNCEVNFDKYGRKKVMGSYLRRV